MPGHDLKQLSSRDFEELTRDLLQAEWNVALEMFKVGRDRGIDLRHISAEGGTTIVQCKHYAASGYEKLLGHLRSKEFGLCSHLRHTAKRFYGRL
jgi:Restriction endonuclease